MKKNKTIKKQPTISFVVPVHNDGDSIDKMLKSLLEQDLPDIEIIAVNDGSTDNTKQILDGYADLNWAKVIHLEKNEGACVARNIGAKEATGKYLSFLPADAVLYPGMARIWYNTLEENPDYDFMYGGYRFINENGEAVMDYMSQPFDPYLLEVTNYIDGSFPIRREAFWKYAKLMNQPDGLWDKNVISLQDWDFWLSVVKNGGKGIYNQDLFFETTIPHPGGLSYDSAANWLTRTEFIKAKHRIPIRDMCVASVGASWHAQRIAWILNADFKQMPSSKPHRYSSLYVIGFYPQFAEVQGRMFFNNEFDIKQGITPAKKVVHLVGSDIMQLYDISLRNLEFYKRYFTQAIDKLLVEADFTQQEVKNILGIEAEIVPIPPAKLYEVMPLPKNFTIAVYQPAMNDTLYRPAEMMEIVKKCPDVKFKFFGNPQKVGFDPALPNIEYCGYINNMEEFIKECSAIIRFPHHDGLPISVLEFLLAGRYSIQSVPIKYTQWLPNDQFKVEKAIEAIGQLKEHVAKNGLNQEGADYWRKELDHDLYRQRIKKICGYEPKEYWENRARSWTDQAAAMPIETEEIKKFIEEIKPKSVLDIGCGDGRWYPYFKEWGIEHYKGIDISENLIKAAQFRFPHLKDNFYPVRVEDFGEMMEMTKENKFDLIFSYTCLEHIKNEEFPKAVESIKKMGKKLLLIEPINFTSRYYCHSHDYKKYFKVIKEQKLKDKIIYLCDLNA